MERLLARDLGPDCPLIARAGLRESGRNKIDTRSKFQTQIDTLEQ